MESINKFKVLTVIVICMFIFVVAAIYTNTKEESMAKKKEAESQSIVNFGGNSGQADDIKMQLELANRRIDELNEKINNNSGNSSSSESHYKCSIYGYVSPSGVVQVPPQDALEQARDNDYNVVLSCEM